MSEDGEELVTLLSSAWELVVKAVQQMQKYKQNYDKKSAPRIYRVGDWVLVNFPADESGKMLKLSRPGHGPYHVVKQLEPDVTGVKVY